MTVESRSLDRNDGRSAFESGDEALDRFFRRYAGQNQFRHHIGVTYVAVETDQMLGFATISHGTLHADALPSGRRLPPYPVPILRMARLAVDRAQRGRGIGRALTRFCIELAEKMETSLDA